MGEEELKDTQQSESGEEIVKEDYLAAIEKQEEKYKAREEALRAENKKLMERIINGREAPKEDKAEESKYRDTEVLKNIICNDESTNLDYWTAFTELRDKIIDEEGYDPCVTGGIGPEGVVNPEYGEAEMVEEQMKIIKECIAIANGDNQVFINETSKRAKFF